MINLYTYRMIRAAFLRNVSRFENKAEAVERMVMLRREYMPELVG